MEKDSLTDRELEVLKYMVLGKNNIEIADELTISDYTIKAHVSSILHKLKVKDRTNAGIKAIQLGLIEI